MSFLYRVEVHITHKNNFFSRRKEVGRVSFNGIIFDRAVHAGDRIELNPGIPGKPINYFLGEVTDFAGPRVYTILKAERYGQNYCRGLEELEEKLDGKSGIKPLGRVLP